MSKQKGLRVLFERETRSASKKVIVGVVVVLVLIAGFFLAVRLFSHTISFPSVEQPLLNGYWVMDNGADFALNVTNLDKNQQSVTGWVTVHNSTGALCYIFEGDLTLKPGETGIATASFSSAYNGYVFPISAAEILSEPSVYIIDVSVAVPVPA